MGKVHVLCLWFRCSGPKIININNNNDNIKIHLFKVEHRIFSVIALKRRKLDHEVEEVGMLLESFVDYFNLSECQSVEPVHFRQMSVTMLLTQLSLKHTHNSTIFFAFPVAAARAWNDLPPRIMASPLLLTFRRQLKTSLFHTTFY